MVTVRLNDEINHRLMKLIEIEKTTKSEIIKKAIIEYYEKYAGAINPFQLGEDFFGRYGGNKDLSKKYKIMIKEKLHEKHPY